MKKENTKELDAAIVLASIQKEAAPLLRSIRAIQITDGKSYNNKAAKVEALKKLSRLAKAKEETFTAPLTKLIKDVKELFAPFRQLVSEAELSAKNEMLGYSNKMDEEKERIKEKFESGKIAKLSTAVRKTAELEINSSSSSIRKIWTVEEIDASLTPKEYMVPDVAKIKEALKAGKKVAGWKWVQKKSIAI